MATEQKFLGVRYATPVSQPLLVQDRVEATARGGRRVPYRTTIGGVYWEWALRFIDSRVTGFGFNRKQAAHMARVGLGAFDLVCPQLPDTVGVNYEMYEEPAGIDSKLLKVDRGASIGTTEVYLERNAGAPTAVPLRAGRFITFGADKFPYMVIGANDLSFTGSGAQQVIIKPNLMVSVLPNVEVHLNPIISALYAIEEYDVPNMEPRPIMYDRTIRFRTA